MKLLKRTITGCLFVAILVYCIISGPIWFFSLFALCTILSVWEFVSLMNKYKGRINRLLVVIASITLFGAIFISSYSYTGLAIFMPFVLSLIALLVIELYKKATSPITNLALSFFPILYIALPFSLLSILAFVPNQTTGMTEYSFVIPLTMFFFIWSNDVGAYCTGCTIGKHKLFERISPKKTWEGSLGGAVLTIVTATLLHTFVPQWYGYMSIWTWIGMAIVVVIFGTWGDLIESMIKRELGIKDSGKILPGHGGMLDRFDSTLLVIPAIVIYFCTVLLFF